MQHAISSQIPFKDIIEILLVLEVLVTDNSETEYLCCGFVSSSDSCFFFNNDVFVLHYFQYDFTKITDKADCFLILAILEVLFLENCHDAMPIFFTFFFRQFSVYPR